MLTLDAIAEERGITSVDLVKIDVDGPDYDVLLGARRLLERARPTVIIEMSARQDAIYAFLKEEARVTYSSACPASRWCPVQWPLNLIAADTPIVIPARGALSGAQVSRAELAAVEPLGEARGRLDSHAAQPQHRPEGLGVEPLVAGLGGERSRMCSTFVRQVSTASGTNTLGEPRSPSYLGISYSRTRWSRNVFQASSATRRWSWWASPREGQKIRSGGPALEALELVLEPRPARGRSRPGTASSRSGRVGPSRKARARWPAPRAPAPAFALKHHPVAPSQRAAAADQVRGWSRRSRSRCRRSALRGRGRCSGPFRSAGELESQHRFGRRRQFRGRKTGCTGRPSRNRSMPSSSARR